MHTSQLPLPAPSPSPLAPLRRKSRLPRSVGVGITVSDVGLFVPINVSSHVRLEPYINFQSTRTDYDVSPNFDTVWTSFIYSERLSGDAEGLVRPKQGLTIFWLEANRHRHARDVLDES